ncbi:MAG: hypothetical protein HY722_05855 [Planctomycetes bacterium]|nr:hypothetical protein [Planctomycetota bacterium]
MHRLALVLPMLVLSSCIILSVHPYVEEGEALKDAGLLGDWAAEEGQVLHIEAGAGNVLRLVYREKATKGVFAGLLTEVAGVRYLDVRPEGEKETDPWGYALSVRAHLLFRLSMGEDRMTLAMISPGFLRGLTKSADGTLAGLQFTATDDDLFLVTSETGALRAFLERHAKTEGCFEEPATFDRVAEKRPEGS